MRLIGVTGTNGKTTTAHIVESILRRRYRTGLIGTLYYKINGVIHKSKDTTPEPPDLQEIFLNMKNQQCDYCVMEVSSHGVDFHRVAGLDYCAGIWTNFTQDHLDWHKTMEAYRSAKLRWFSTIKPENHVAVNIDDPSVDYFIRAARAKVITYGLTRSAAISASDVRFSGRGTDFILQTPQGNIEVHAKLRGQFNLYNMLSAVGVLQAEGLSLTEIKNGLEDDIVVAGRFQSVECGQDFTVLVDYAHTPDGMIKVLNAARSMNPKRIITVFGCGGDRDRTKRPEMASIVEKGSDYFIVTDDNPRTEDPEQIMNDIMVGISAAAKGRYEIIHDRHDAIHRAMALAQPGDLVLLAGKGHETTQTLKDRTIHFNDFEVAREILNSLI